MLPFSSVFTVALKRGYTQSLLGWPCLIPPDRYLQHQQLPLGLVNGCFPVAEKVLSALSHVLCLPRFPVPLMGLGTV